MLKILNILFAISAIVFIQPSAYAQQGDAENGEVLFSQKCAFCHGDAGQGITAPALVGCSRCDSLQSLYDKIDPSMPKENPDSCVDTCAWDTAAYILEVLNGGDQTTTTTVPATTTVSATTTTPTTTTMPATTTTSISEEPCPAETIYGKGSEEAQILREYRDNVLVRTQEGQKLIRLYYKWSPAILQAMEENYEVKSKLKIIIDEMLPAVRERLE